MAVPATPVRLMNISERFSPEAELLSVPPVKAGLAGLRTGAGQVNVMLSEGFEKLSRFI